MDMIPTPGGVSLPVLISGTVLVCLVIHLVTNRADKVPMARRCRGSLLWRFVTGAPLDGWRRTDATFLRPARNCLDPYGRLSPWGRLPGWRRGAVRLALTLAVAGAGWGFAVNPVGTLTVTLIAAAVLAVGGLAWSVRGVRRWRLRRTVTEPLADALRPVFGSSAPAGTGWVQVPRCTVHLPASRPGRWVRAAGTALRRLARRVEPFERAETAVLLWGDGRADRRTDRRPVRIELPRDFGGVDSKSRGTVVAIAASRLGGEWEGNWQLTGTRPVLELRVLPKPPGKVTFDDLVPHLEAAGPTELVLGLAARSHPVAVDLDTEAPHVLLSMGTGAGKSVTARSFGVQALHKGWAVVILDLKQESHPWAKELIDAGEPGITYCRKPAEVHAALLALDAERESRADSRWIDKHAQFQRVLVIAEELNITANALREYWQSIKERGQPAKSPASSALGNITCAGRSVAMHVLAIGQMLTAQVFGGPESRENFGVRILGRYSPNNWRILVPEISMPRSTDIRGRIQVCRSGVATATQVGYLSDDEARAWAVSGVDSDAPPGVIPFRLGAGVPSHRPSLTKAAMPASEASPDADTDASGDTAPVSDERRYTLAEACEAGILPMNYEAAKRARSRAVARGAFPESADGRYTEGELREWHGSRPRAVS